MLQPRNPYILRNVPRFSPSKIFSFWHCIPLDSHWIDHSYQFWPCNPWTRRAAAPQRQFHDISIYKKTVSRKISQKAPFGR